MYSRPLQGCNLNLRLMRAACARNYIRKIKCQMAMNAASKYGLLYSFRLELLAVVVVVVLIGTAFVFWVINEKFYRERSGQQRKDWWKYGVMYHIYPRSFYDSSGDGNGDLKGITQRLEYLQYLGVKIIYLSPIFESPMVDQGYDISNFKNINPLFGTMKDFDELLARIHNKDMKLVLDFVPNHTSDKHPWFVESRKSRTNPKRDWYVWCDPGPQGGPPNNWVSVFGGSMWSYDRHTHQYYLHQFYKEQPDLNFRNPEVREVMKDVLKHWLDKGVDGFRVDAVPHLLEDKSFRDEPVKPSLNVAKPNHGHFEHIYTMNVKGIHEICREWRHVFESYKDCYRLLIGECSGDIHEVIKYFGTTENEFDMLLNFCFTDLTKWHLGKTISNKVTDYLRTIPENKWPSWFLGNHDMARIGTRVCPTNRRAMNVLLLTLPGTPITYYGEEIGMVNANIPTHLQYDQFGRDPQRCPMQWTNASNHGFSCSTNSWLQAPKASKIDNVEYQRSSSVSMLQLYRKLVKLRSKETAFQELKFQTVYSDSDLFIYLRFSKDSHYLVAINFGKRTRNLQLGNIKHVRGEIVIDSEMRRNNTSVKLKHLKLKKGQALVINLC